MKLHAIALTIFLLLAALTTSAWAEPEPGTTKKFNRIKFVWCPAGSFSMGRNPGESGSTASESPAHTVTFAKGFWISKYEITQAQWQRIMGFNPSYHQGVQYPDASRRPVENVSWNDVQDFIEEMNSRFTKRHYRLPTEAEWEYACRAGTTTRYFWGEDPNADKIRKFAWYQTNSGGETHPVGEKRRNAWNLFDTSGNVWEWVQDPWHDTYDGAPTDGSAWESSKITYRTVRGGSWFNNATVCRSAFRGPQDPNGVFGDYGFRLVVEK